MKKEKALELLGGHAAAAEAIGISYQAISQWPVDLPARIADRVLAALARKHLPSALLGDACNSEALTGPEGVRHG